MGRFRCKEVILLCALLLMCTGCYDQPADINPDLPYIDKVVGGNAVDTGEADGPDVGNDNYHYTEPDKDDSHTPSGTHATNPNGLPIEGYTDEDLAELEERIKKWNEDYDKAHNIDRSEHDTQEPEEDSIPEVVEVTYENAHTLTEEQLYSFYGNQNLRGYYNGDGSFYDPTFDCWGTSLNMSYYDAYNYYVQEYGQPSISFKTLLGEFCYWFMDEHAYCISNKSLNVVWSVSKYNHVVSEEGVKREFVNSIANPSSIINDAYTTYGTTYHVDYFNYIYKTPSGWLIIDREDNGTFVI